MSFPYSSYSELAPGGFTYYEESPAMGEADLSGPQLIHDNSPSHLLRPFPSLHSYSIDQNPIPCPLPNEHYMFEEFNGLSPVIWDSTTEQETYFNGTLVHSFSPTDFGGFNPETYSPAHHVSYPTDHSYTRMFRGRKSKSAAEVLDELRPYACDICQAAFARSHDRDRHKRSHTGETPYRCHGCGTGFKRPDARKRHWERDPVCAQEDWIRVRHTPEGAKRRARAKTKPIKKQIQI